MERSFWQERWDARQIGFHEGKANDLLVAHFARLGLAPGARVLVPLAGKASDLLWLADRGLEVVGVEFVRKAIDELFAENGLAPTARKLGSHPALSAGGLTLVHGDMFAMRPEDLGRFDAVYDRAALVALDPPTRRRYVETCRGLAKPGAPTFLITIGYDARRKDGPPWSVDDAVVNDLFSDRSVEKLEARPMPGGERFGVGAVSETAWLIRPA